MRTLKCGVSDKSVLVTLFNANEEKRPPVDAGQSQVNQLQAQTFGIKVPTKVTLF